MVGFQLDDSKKWEKWGLSPNIHENNGYFSRAPGDPSISGHKDPQHPNKRKSLDLPPTQDAIVANKGLGTGIPEPKNPR